jgi:hypothetical protein
MNKQALKATEIETFALSTSAALDELRRPVSHDGGDYPSGFSALIFDRTGSGAYPRQADPRMTLQKLPRVKCGSLSASTSEFTLPKVVSGLCLLPS